MSQIERTLIVLKPDTLARGLCGEILTRFEKVGLKIVAMKMLKPNKDFFYHHYETIGSMISRRGEKPFNDNLVYMQKSPVIAIVLEWIEAPKLVRKMVGTTEPQVAFPGTVRGDYAHISFSYADSIDKAIPNLIHASGDSQEAEQEVAHWFKPEELFDYDRADQEFMY